jgi:hypothetical protein
MMTASIPPLAKLARVKLVANPSPRFPKMNFFIKSSNVHMGNSYNVASCRPPLVSALWKEGTTKPTCTVASARRSAGSPPTAHQHKQLGELRFRSYKVGRVWFPWVHIDIESLKGGMGGNYWEVAAMHLARSDRKKRGMITDAIIAGLTVLAQSTPIHQGWGP